MSLLPITGYDIATVTNPSSSLIDFTLMIDLSLMSSEWWSEVDTSDGTKGRAAKNNDNTELACDWIDFDNINQTGYLRVKWSGSLATNPSIQQIRVYPPKASNDSVLPSATYGSDNAYDEYWSGYWPLHESLTDRIGGGSLTLYNSASLTGGSLSLDSSTSDYAEQLVQPILDYPYTLIVRAKTTKDDSTFMYYGDRSNSVQWLTLDVYVGSGSGRVWDRDGSSSVSVFSASAINDNNWYQVSMVTELDSGSDYNLSINIDGSFEDSSVKTKTRNFLSFDSINFGRKGNIPSPSSYVNGNIEEGSIHSTNRSIDWIEEEHNQTNDNSLFWGTWNWVSYPDSLEESLELSNASSDFIEILKEGAEKSNGLSFYDFRENINSIIEKLQEDNASIIFLPEYGEVWDGSAKNIADKGTSGIIWKVANVSSDIETTSFLNQSKNINDLNYTAIDTTAGAIEYTATYDGINEVTAANVILPTVTGASVSYIFIYKTATNNAYGRIVDTCNDNTDGVYLQHGNDGLEWSFKVDTDVGNSDARAAVVAPDTWADNNWHMVTGVITKTASGYDFALYLDDGTISDSDSNSGVVNHSNPLHIFRPAVGSADFDGTVGVLAVLPKALTTNEIADYWDRVNGDIYSGLLSMGELRRRDFVNEMISLSPKLLFFPQNSYYNTNWLNIPNQGDIDGIWTSFNNSDASKNFLSNSGDINKETHSLSVDFNGDSSYFELQDDLGNFLILDDCFNNVQSDQSLIVIFRTEDNSAQRTLISIDAFGCADGAGPLLQLRGSNTIRLFIDASSDFSVNYADGEWHVIVVNFDISTKTASIYFDNSETPNKTNTWNTYPDQSNTPLWIGRRYNNFIKSVMDGEIAMVSVVPGLLDYNQRSLIQQRVNRDFDFELIGSGYSIGNISTVDADVEAFNWNNLSYHTNYNINNDLMLNAINYSFIAIVKFDSTGLNIIDAYDESNIIGYRLFIDDLGYINLNVNNTQLTSINNNITIPNDNEYHLIGIGKSSNKMFYYLDDQSVIFEENVLDNMPVSHGGSLSEIKIGSGNSSSILLASWPNALGENGLPTYEEIWSSFNGYLESIVNNSNFSIINSPYLPFGTRYLSGAKAYIDTDSEKNKINITFLSEEEVTESDREWFVGGLGIRLFKKDNNYYPGVVLDNNYNLSNIQSFIQGVPIAVNRTDDKLKKCLSVYYSGRSSDKYEDWETIIEGHPFPLNENFDLIAVNVSAESYDEEKEVFIGGIPNTVRRVGENWYLVFSVK